jgi:hypothetical protein
MLKLLGAGQCMPLLQSLLHSGGISTDSNLDLPSIVLMLPYWALITLGCYAMLSSR